MIQCHDSERLRAAAVEREVDAAEIKKLEESMCCRSRRGEDELGHHMAMLKDELEVWKTWPRCRPPLSKPSLDSSENGGSRSKRGLGR